ncbi:MAG: hypothetical protein ABIR70_18720 [Bryobacteraceae bacterium]
MSLHQARLAGLWVLIAVNVWGQVPPTKAEAPEPRAADQRTQLNLAGQTNTATGESQRNENVRINPIDTNTERELTRRIGATATIVREFPAERNYFASEYGRTPDAPLHLSVAATPSRRIHGTLWENHQNSITSARSFFQVGGVLPARENEYGFRVTSPLWKSIQLSLDGNQQKSRGMVNGNVLVPRADERTPLTTDPQAYKLIASWLAGYPTLAPNLPDLDARALNTNAPQRIDTNALSGRLDAPLGAKNALSLRYQVTAQHVKAFQLVAGQNPDSDLHNQRVTTTWRRVFSPAMQGTFSAGFDRTTTSIRPDVTSPPVRINVTNVIQTIGNDTDVPIRRTQNLFRESGALEGIRGNHRWHAGGELMRTQMNSLEQDSLRPVFTFQNNFGNDAVTNLRKGLVTSFNQLIGDTYRGYRTWKTIGYFDDTWRATKALTMHIGLRYEPLLRPTEVNSREIVPFGCSCGALAPRFAISYRLPGNWGVLRSGYGLDYGQMFVATFGQIRMNLPNAARISVNTPNLLNPLNGITFRDIGPNFRSAFYDIASNLGLPYAHTYNASWEWRSSHGVQLQLGYVGSRAHRLFETLYNNRGGKVADVSLITPATVNSRRADQTRFDIFRVHNGAKSYFDAARVTLTMPSSHGFSGEVSYWLSKGLDFGTDYTSTVSGPNTRQGRSPSEFFVHDTMKGLASFDQPHAFLLRLNYQTPQLTERWARAIIGRWSANAVWLLKSGTPFSVETGSDGPGFGNVDGQNSDRPNVLDPRVLGRTIGNPDTATTLLPASAFGFLKPSDYVGNLGRDTFRRGKITNVNSSIERSWSLPRDWSLQLRAEAVNLFNTPQFDQPVFLLASPTFGKITNTLNGGRLFHFRLQVQF